MAGFGDVKAAERKILKGFDKPAFVKSLTDSAFPPYGQGQCAAHIRQALQAGGVNTLGNPGSAKDYGTFLLSRGFNKIAAAADYVPSLGDIMVFQSIPGHEHGHVQGFDGKNWVSDFVQRDMYANRSYKTQNAAYAIYRF